MITIGPSTRCFALLLVALLTSSVSPAQFREAVERDVGLLRKLEDCLEGYAASVGGETITYGRLRPDFPVALLTRAGTGTMTIDWQTQRTPRSLDRKQVTFALSGGIYGQEETGKKFRVSVNGMPRFVFSTNKTDAWEVKGEGGGALAFDGVMRDRYGDVFGYLRVTLPTEWIVPGEPVRLSVTGEKAGSSAWFMVYQDSGVVAFLREKVTHEAYCDLQFERRNQEYAVSISATSAWTGKPFRCVGGDAQDVTGTFAPGEGKTTAAFTFKAQKPERFRFFVDGEQIVDLMGFSRDVNESRMYPTKLVSLKGRSPRPGSWSLEYQSTHSQVGTALSEFSRTYAGNGTQHLVISTHQDIAWMDSPEQCAKLRDERIISPALAVMRQNPDYRFGLEDVLCLREYLERHPDRKGEIWNLMKEGRLTIGASYTQPYEELSSGEMLVRQFTAGRKWLKVNFPGCDSRIYWNVDVPGRSLQMPQIMLKSGVKALVMSRFEKGLFNWLSPDGSGVVAYSPSHYATFTEHAVGKEFHETAEYLASTGSEWSGGIRNGSKNIPVLCMSDMSTAVTFDDFMEKWNALTSITEPGKPVKQLSLPPLRYSTAESFFDAVRDEHLQLPLVKGERPNIWLYIHGPTHHWAISAKREADIELPAAEMFSAIEGVLAKTFARYPQHQLAQAWEAQVYPDHGWGGKNGEITDSTFRAKYEYARDTGKRIRAQATGAIAARVRTVETKGIPVMVFNSLSWKRTVPVRWTATFEKGRVRRGVVLFDETGKTVVSQLLGMEQHSDGSVKSADILFVAEDVPPIGYATYYIRPSQKVPPGPAKDSALTAVLENGFYRITLGEGGVRQILDKELGVKLLDTGEFLGGELFTMQSVGEDAGEWAEPQQPTMDGFDKLSRYKPPWRLVESGAVRQVVEIHQDIAHATVVQRIILYRSLKQIDFETSLLAWDGTKYREFRLAFPIDMPGGQVAYEVPFGVLEVGKDEMKGAPGERYTQAASNVRPRGIQNWIGVSNGTTGVTISSSVAVWDYQDPRARPMRSSLLQPVLLASRRSCHGEGNWYLQQGDHHYRFSLTSHRGDWRNGKRFGVSANIPMPVVFHPERASKQDLPEQKSFLSLDAKNAVVSTIKKGDDGETIFVRIFEDEGENSTVKLRWGMPIESAAMTDLIEEGGEPLPVNRGLFAVNLGHHAIQTISVVPHGQGR